MGNKEQVHTVTDLPSAGTRKKILLWGGTAVAGVAAALLIVNTRARKTETDENQSA
jgi:hypothetical protein